MNALRAPSASFLEHDKALACIHCGLCLSSCPTYLETGNENDSPRGRIYLMRGAREGRLPVGSTLVRHVDLCLGCRACEAVCPSAVPYGELLEATREHIEATHRRPARQRLLRRWALERVVPFPARLRWAVRLGRLVNRSGVGRLLPRLAQEALSLLPEDDGGDALPEFSPAATGSRRGRVGFLSGCVMSVLFPRTNAATIRLLNRAGYDVLIPRQQVCCGALYAHSGNLARAQACARRNVAVFQALDLDAVITNAAGCGSTLKEYGRLLAHDPAVVEAGRGFAARVKDFAEFLAQAGVAPVPVDAVPNATVTCHDACHLAHAQRITLAPRRLLREVAGVRLLELEEADVCCGSAGSYNLTEPAMAARLQRRKTANILRTGVSTVVTTNPGCILQIQAGLRAAGVGHVKVLHLADYLDGRLPR